jgi:peptidylprolyl isomerase
MSQQQVGTRSSSERPPTRAEKRKQWKAAAAKAAAARRRRQVIFGTLGSLTVVVLLGALLFNVLRDPGGDNPGARPGTQGPDVDNAAESDFPPLPPGADPALKTKPVTAAECGTVTQLKVTPLITGTGPAAQAGQSITVNYVGVSCTTGAEFDASWKRSQTFDFQLGGGSVIKGWDEGLKGVTVGSRVQLDIPSNMAYGDDASSGRPTGPLRFVVDVLAAA